MNETGLDNMLNRVRRALGRREGEHVAPVPPELPDPIVRLVHSEIGLSELFAKRAAEMGSKVESVRIDELAKKIIEFCKSRSIKRLAVSSGSILDKLDFAGSGIEVRRWNEITLDQMYDFDAGLTDATYAVAETGSLVISTHSGNGRALSLVPMTHIAVVEPKNILPDLVDLMQKLRERSHRDYTVLISGPSKTADIEMNVVTGVHGPNLLQIYLLA